MAIRESGVDSVVSLGDDDLREVVDTSGTILVEFNTEWCRSSQRLQPILDGLAVYGDATVDKVDRAGHRESIIEFGAQSTPTFVPFADGKPVKRLRGPQGEQTLRNLLAEYSPQPRYREPP